MGIPEIAYRLYQAGQAILERHGFGLATVPERSLSSATGHAWVDTLPVVFEREKAQYLSRADQVISGSFNVFALESVKLGFPPDWNKDPKTGKAAPMQFGKTIDYRDEAIVGDIKYLWEPNRHLELVWLAQAWHLSKDDRYLDGARCLLSSWFKQNPYPFGVNWTSSLEHAIRLINWSFAWHIFGGPQSPLLSGPEGEALEKQWMESVYQHCFFISKHHSKYSSANNHLLGEFAGLFIGAVTWPLWDKSLVWEKDARLGLEEQSLLQNAPDGGNREQAIWYQHEVIDFLLIAGLLARNTGSDFSEQYWKRLELLMEFIASLMDVDGNIPMLGDSDDAIIVKLSVYPEVYKSLLATGAVLFSRSDFKAKGCEVDDKTRWLLGDIAAKKFEAVPPDSDKLQLRREFRDSGYYLLGCNFGSQDEIRMLADAGPLGYLGIAAHGHADALALTLSVAGHEILIDPGTYAYHTESEWRNYFKGTSAHNTVRIDNVDQSVSAGNFMWTRHARAECLKFEYSDAEDVWIAEHDGYQRLSDPVSHKRMVSFDKSQRIFLVCDTLECNDEHSVEIHWHFNEKSLIQVRGRIVHIQLADVLVRMSMRDLSLEPEIFHGQSSPPLGWVSRRFDTKKPSPTLRWSGRISSSCQFITEISISRNEA
jgi:hypothetical protein